MHVELVARFISIINWLPKTAYGLAMVSGGSQWDSHLVLSGHWGPAVSHHTEHTKPSSGISSHHGLSCLSPVTPWGGKCNQSPFLVANIWLFHWRPEYSPLTLLPMLHVLPSSGTALCMPLKPVVKQSTDHLQSGNSLRWKFPLHSFAFLGTTDGSVTPCEEALPPGYKDDI